MFTYGDHEGRGTLRKQAVHEFSLTVQLLLLWLLLLGVRWPTGCCVYRKRMRPATAT
jgi:hypothetical protein